MKILVCHRPEGAFGYISDGWINALQDRGHSVSRWDGHQESWKTFQPEMYIGCSGHKQPIPRERGRCKLAIHVNPYGPVQIKGVSESRENIDWTLRQRPDVVFGYGHANDQLLWSYWSEHTGVPWVSLPTAGDAVVYGHTPTGHRKYDVVYLGGRWAYKAETIDKFLLPVLRDGRLKAAVRGWGEWPDGLCVGRLPEGREAPFLASGLVGPCLSEPHTQRYGFDLPERVFKVILSGTLAIHDPVPGVHQFIPSLVVAQNSQNFVDLCHHHSRPQHAAERAQLVEAQRQEVLSGHTYHHRMRDLLAALEFGVAADRMVGNS